MSKTEIYAVKENEDLIFIGECRNAFRGAMYVWNDIAKRYFNLESFPHFDEDMQKRVWNAGNENQLTQSEEIVLASTMDRAIVKKENINLLLVALNEYGSKHENSSILEQANLIKERLSDIPDGYSIAWIQTTVCDGWFREYDEDSDEYVCNMSGFFDVMDQQEPKQGA
jgi:hypothetical protein